MPVDLRHGRSPRSGIAGATIDQDSADVEEEKRFTRWLAASDDLVREHKDATGWEEPPRGVLRRRRKRDG